MGPETIGCMVETPVRHAEVRVDLAAIRDNVATLIAHSPGAAVLAVVKADGYGHLLAALRGSAPRC